MFCFYHLVYISSMTLVDKYILTTLCNSVGLLFFLAARVILMRCSCVELLMCVCCSKWSIRLKGWLLWSESCVYVIWLFMHEIGYICHAKRLDRNCDNRYGALGKGGLWCWWRPICCCFLFVTVYYMSLFSTEISLLPLCFKIYN